MMSKAVFVFSCFVIKPTTTETKKKTLPERGGRTARGAIVVSSSEVKYTRIHDDDNSSSLSIFFLVSFVILVNYKDLIHFCLQFLADQSMVIAPPFLYPPCLPSSVHPLFVFSSASLNPSSHVHCFSSSNPVTSPFCTRHYRHSSFMFVEHSPVVLYSHAYIDEQLIGSMFSAS